MFSNLVGYKEDYLKRACHEIIMKNLAGINFRVFSLLSTYTDEEQLNYLKQQHDWFEKDERLVSQREYLQKLNKETFKNTALVGTPKNFLAKYNSHKNLRTLIPQHHNRSMNYLMKNGMVGKDMIDGNRKMTYYYTKNDREGLVKLFEEWMKNWSKDTKHKLSKNDAFYLSSLIKNSLWFVCSLNLNSFNELFSDITSEFIIKDIQHKSPIDFGHGEGFKDGFQEYFTKEWKERKRAINKHLKFVQKTQEKLIDIKIKVSEE